MTCPKDRPHLPGPPLKLVTPANAETASKPAEPIAFVEDFDWKARMRPDPVETITTPALHVPPAAARAEDQAVGIATPLDMLLPDAPLSDDMIQDAALLDSALPSLSVPDGPAFGNSLSPMPLTTAPDGGAGLSLPFTLPVFGPDLTGIGAASNDVDDPEPAEDTSAIHMVAAEPESAADALSDDEQCVRELLRELIREELLGELGQRFSRNLKSVIRREVAAMIDDQLERM